MGFLTRFFGKSEKRGTYMDMILSSRGVSMDTATGKNITTLGSMQNGAVFACIRALSESVAGLPLILYQRQKRGKKRATHHSLYRLLHQMPNPEMTSYELRELLVSHVAAWGNGYLEIQRDKAGRVRALWPLRPDRVEILRDPRGKLNYRVRIDHNENVTLPWRNVMHVRGLGYDGVRGYSVIALARQSIGLGMATEEFGARFFGNGARPGVVLEHPGQLSDRAHKQLRESWSARHQGLENAHRVAILEEGMKIQEVGIPPEDAQFLETRKFTVEEIARWFKVPPHLIGHLERSTFSNIEHQGLEFVIYTLRPWLVRIEQAMSRDLLTSGERTSYFPEHLVDGLLRGDIKSRYEAYAQGRQNGWLSANDIRELENMNPIEGGDVYLSPLNMVPSDQLSDNTTPDSGSDAARMLAVPELRTELRTAKKTAAARLTIARDFHPLFEDAARRAVRRETADVGRANEKYLRKQQDRAAFLAWLRNFYNQHPEFWRKQTGKLLTTYARQMDRAIADELGREPGQDIDEFVERYRERLAERESNSSRMQLEAILRDVGEDNVEAADALDTRLDEWQQKRPGKVAHAESRRANNAFAKALYIAAGVSVLHWVATGDNCPYCQALDGTIVGIQEPFLKKGVDFNPQGAESPINVGTHNVGHPPLHDECDCMIVAG